MDNSATGLISELDQTELDLVGGAGTWVESGLAVGGAGAAAGAFIGGPIGGAIGGVVGFAVGVAVHHI